jgi:hypothetical protein
MNNDRFASLLSSFPQGADPATYRLDQVTCLLGKAGYLSIFSKPDPSRPDIPIFSPSDPNALIAVQVREDLHRFGVEVQPPSVEKGLGVCKHIGESVARIQVDWTLCPDDFQAAPGLYPPPTVLDGTRSQRFTMLNGQMTWLDRPGSGFRSFGTGRTFPVLINGQPQLRLGAVIDVLEGFGRFQGLNGTFVVNGYITPPQGLALNIIIRFADPEGKLYTPGPVAPLQETADPDTGTEFLMVIGEADPSHGMTIEPTATGIRAGVRERLRLVRISYDIASERGVRTRTSTGQVVGTFQGNLLFNLVDPNPVTPLYGTDGVFTFFDRRGRPVATLNASVVEGRAFRTTLPGAPAPVFRFGGFGPFIGGTGAFQGTVGMMSVNAAISVFPRALSTLYVLRVSDPDGRFRASCSRAWS